MTANPSAIEAKAAEWTVRLSSNSLNETEQAELAAWLEADVRHHGALIRAQSAWIDLDRVAALHRVPQDSECVSRTSPITTQMTRRALLAAGLGAVALAGASGSFWAWRRRGEVYESDIGEVRRVTLSDGSTMDLDSATRALVRFSDSRREIELVRGQGLFEVTKDAARPFIVLTRGVSVRAVGTAFAVRAVDDDVAVTVTKGVVEVTGGAPGGAARVSADQRAVVSAVNGIKVQALPVAQVERHLAWREGMLSFDGESLAEAVKELNRHSSRHIEIDDDELGANPVVGIFRAADTRGFAHTVAAALGAASIEESDAIHLRRRSHR